MEVGQSFRNLQYLWFESVAAFCRRTGRARDTHQLGSRCFMQPIVVHKSPQMSMFLPRRDHVRMRTVVERAEESEHAWMLQSLPDLVFPFETLTGYSMSIGSDVREEYLP